MPSFWINISKLTVFGKIKLCWPVNGTPIAPLLKYCLRYPCLKSDRHKLLILCRGPPSIQHSCKVWFKWPSGFKLETKVDQMWEVFRGTTYDELGEQQTTDVVTTGPNDGKGLQFKYTAKIDAYLFHDLCAVQKFSYKTWVGKHIYPQFQSWPN